MKPEDFKSFKYFSANEAWGDIAKLQWWHVQHLNTIREAMSDEVNWAININCSSEDGHSQKSYHPRGMATDFHFKTDIHIATQYDILKSTLVKLNLWDFVGLGTYPEWHIPGFHLDGRGTALQWIRKHGKYYYGEDNVIQMIGNKKGPLN